MIAAAGQEIRKAWSVPMAIPQAANSTRKGLQMHICLLFLFVLFFAPAVQAQTPDLASQSISGYGTAVFAEMSLTVKLLIATGLVAAGIVFLTSFINRRNAVSFTLEQLKQKIRKIRQADKQKNIYIGVDGDAAVGKTTLTNSFSENPNLIVIHADNYREENCHFFYNWEKLKADLEVMIAGRQGLVIVIEGWRLFLDICPKDSGKKHPYIAHLNFDMRFKQPYILNIDFDLRANVKANYKTKLANLRDRHPDGDEEDIVIITLRQLRDYAGVKYDFVFRNSAKYRIPQHYKFNIMPA